MPAESIPWFLKSLKIPSQTSLCLIIMLCVADDGKLQLWKEFRVTSTGIFEQSKEARNRVVVPARHAGYL